MMEHIWPIGLKASEVPSQCECTFDPISPSESVLSAVNIECPCHGVDAQRRAEKLALYPMRYGMSNKALTQYLDQVEADRRKRIRESRWKRWLRIKHYFTGHSHQMHFLNERSMEWIFVCECGHTTNKILEADA